MQSMSEEFSSNSTPEGMGRKRWLSTALMKLLLEERSYGQAAELALGMESVFAMLGRHIDEILDDKERWPDRITFTKHLKPTIDEAYAEIDFNCRWTRDVLAELPNTTEAIAVRRAFDQVALARGGLVSKLLSIHDRYLLAQQAALEASQVTGKNHAK